MSLTGKKIEKIISQIEQSNLFMANTETKMTTSEVVNILLHNNKNESHNVESSDCLDTNEKYYFDMNELLLWKEKNNQSYQIDYYRSLYSNRKFVGRFIVFIKRVIRKCVRFLIEPIVKDQNEFNASVTASINALYNNEIVTQEFLNRKIELINSINKLNDNYNALTNKLQKVEERFQELDEIKVQLNELGHITEELGQLELEKVIIKVQEIAEEKVQKEDIDVLYNKIEEINKNNNKEIYDIKDKLGEISDLQSQEIYHIKDTLDELSDIQSQEIHTIKNSIEKLNNSHLKDLSDLKTQLLDFHEKHIEMLRKVINNKHNEEVDNINNKIDEIELTFLRALKNNEIISSQNDKEICISNKQEHDNTEDTYSLIDYFKFENYFRGSRISIKKSLEKYIDYFINKGDVVDLGCGRGEFLELLHENGIHAIGVDSYEEFVDYCRIKGYNTVKDDAIAYIISLNNESVGGIFASQLIEHLTNQQLIKLCNEAYKKLTQGSYLILETPNPTSLSIYTNAFYMDPSHTKPVHPKTLEYFLKQAGFSNIKVIFTEDSKVGYRLPLLEAQYVDKLSEFNDGINCISDILFGSQNYAIIAQK